MSTMQEEHPVTETANCQGRALVEDEHKPKMLSALEFDGLMERTLKPDEETGKKMNRISRKPDDLALLRDHGKAGGVISMKMIVSMYDHLVADNVCAWVRLKAGDVLAFPPYRQIDSKYEHYSSAMSKKGRTYCPVDCDRWADRAWTEVTTGRGRKQKKVWPTTIVNCTCVLCINIKKLRTEQQTAVAAANEGAGSAITPGTAPGAVGNPVPCLSPGSAFKAGMQAGVRKQRGKDAEARAASRQRMRDAEAKERQVDELARKTRLKTEAQRQRLKVVAAGCIPRRLGRSLCAQVTAGQAKVEAARAL